MNKILELNKKKKLGYAAVGVLFAYFPVCGSKKVVDISTRVDYIGIGLLAGFLGAVVYIELIS